MDSHLPLPALLSHALVAFIVEFDNEFEHQAPHRTSDHGSTPGFPHAPWLVSRVMWSRFMRFVPQDGISAGELQRVLGITRKDMDAWLTRMGKWWGYVSVQTDARSGPMVRPTVGGGTAQTVWTALTPLIEERWIERFGKGEIDVLRSSLAAVAGQLDAGLPDSLPILGYGLWSKELDQKLPAAASSDLPGLLSKVLLAFAIEFESEAEVSLAISANVLRLAGEEGVRIRDLPRLAGVSKEGIAMAVKFLERRACAVVKPEAAGSRAKLLALTAHGRRAREQYHQLAPAIEERWRARLGAHAAGNLRDSLARLAGELFRGLEPYPDGWRASVPRPEALPHFPMVLHRGGFHDGS